MSNYLKKYFKPLQQYYIHSANGMTYRTVAGESHLEFYSEYAGCWIGSSRRSCNEHLSVLTPIVHPLLLWTVVTAAITIATLSLGSTL